MRVCVTRECDATQVEKKGCQFEKYVPKNKETKAKKKSHYSVAVKELLINISRFSPSKHVGSLKCPGKSFTFVLVTRSSRAQTPSTKRSHTALFSLSGRFAGLSRGGDSSSQTTWRAATRIQRVKPSRRTGFRLLRQPVGKPLQAPAWRWTRPSTDFSPPAWTKHPSWDTSGLARTSGFRMLKCSSTAEWPNGTPTGATTSDCWTGSDWQSTSSCNHFLNYHNHHA